MDAPFPWYGGKARVAPLVWRRFGQVQNYVEPFFGSGAVLLGRPQPISGTETVNDLDGFIANFWRAVAADPEAVARYADWPINENDLHARHAWLVERRGCLQANLEGEPSYYDAQFAGWWVWGICAWIGSGWCSGDGPWQRTNVGTEEGPDWQLVHLGSAGQGINRKRVHLGNAGQGVHRQRALAEWFAALSQRLRYVRVCSGDWSRVLGPTPTTKLGLTAVFLDPPYSTAAERTGSIYAQDDGNVAHAVRDWCIAHGADRQLRVALCGYMGEGHDVLLEAGWDRVQWKAHGGYGSQGNGRGRANALREAIWFSPHCLPTDRLL